MSPNATPATQSEHQCYQMPRLPHQLPGSAICDKVVCVCVRKLCVRAVCDTSATPKEWCVCVCNIWGKAAPCLSAMLRRGTLSEQKRNETKHVACSPWKIEEGSHVASNNGYRKSTRRIPYISAASVSMAMQIGRLVQGPCPRSPTKHAGSCRHALCSLRHREKCLCLSVPTLSATTPFRAIRIHPRVANT